MQIFTSYKLNTLYIRMATWAIYLKYYYENIMLCLVDNLTPNNERRGLPFQEWITAGKLDITLFLSLCKNKKKLKSNLFWIIENYS